MTYPTINMLNTRKTPVYNKVDESGEEIGGFAAAPSKETLDKDLHASRSRLLPLALNQNNSAPSAEDEYILSLEERAQDAANFDNTRDTVDAFFDMNRPAGYRIVACDENENSHYVQPQNPVQCTTQYGFNQTQVQGRILPKTPPKEMIKNEDYWKKHAPKILDAE